MKEKIIVFYAPFGKGAPVEKLGGAEAGCIKTLQFYKRSGFKVIQVHKPVKKNSSLGYLLNLLLIPFVLMFKLLKSKDAVLHIAGFYLKLAPYEWFLTRVSRLIRRRYIYEIRNGGMVESYLSGGAFYQFFLKNIFKDSSLILCQGATYVTFLKDSFEIEGFYYPNYIQDRFLQEKRIKDKDRSTLQLVFLGRIVPDKNIHFVVDILKSLVDQGQNCTLKLIGSFEAEYHQELIKRLNHWDLNESVDFLGRLEMSKILEVLKCSDFFLFPSKEKREGHSNALTEAMAVGLIPIVSDIGFNRTIVGDNKFVVDSFDAKLYAERIISLEKVFDFYSNQVVERIHNNFTEQIVCRRFEEAVNKLFAN
ncbi:glycosyltransferase family 4 protein [Sphingobacterium sp. MYb382]|uniref:glycosyltransferase family 4 protein n=1 Tax=Sphingobacterium sp. MYb382 TaxID=2745278 RepID=UPI0030A9C7D4